MYLTLTGITPNDDHAREPRRDGASVLRLKLVGACACALAALMALTPIAGADERRYPMKAAQTVRTAPYTSASKMGSVWNGEMIEIHCQDWGSSVNGSKLWDYIQYDVDGRPGIKKRGWVPNYYVKTGTTQPLKGVKQGRCPKPEVKGDRGQPRPPAGPTPRPPAGPTPRPPAGPTPRPPAPPPAAPPASPPTGPPAGCNPAGVTSQLKMTVTAYRGRSRRAGRTVTTGDAGSVTIRGRLTTPDGAPVRGARICVAVREAGPYAPLNASALAVTDADGGFSYEPPSGPSRRVWFLHPGRDGLAARSVLVNVRPRLRLRPSRRSLRNGQTLVLSGQLRSGPQPKGVLVELQTCRSRNCSTSGARWQTFGTTSTLSGGRFRLRYRFTRTVGVQRYTLRARVPSQPGYPYATGASSPVRVRVSG